MVETRGALRLPVNGEEIIVPSALHLSCAKGHGVVLRFEDARRLDAEAMAIYRRKQGLLAADEVRSIRERFDLGQTDFARLLRLSPRDLSRWESGRSVQTVTMDILLRVVRDLPGSISYLRWHAASIGPPR